MVSRMGIEPIFFKNLRLFVLVLLLLAYMKLVVGTTSREAGDASMMMRCRENERKALLEFKRSVVDDYGILSSWGSGEEECCKWRGIECSNRTGHIIVLDLHGWSENASVWVHLSGKVSPSFLELKNLKYLNLGNNDFQSSPIPELIGSLSKLQGLNLAAAGFFGTIPHQLGNLTDLRSLDLGSNAGLTVENLGWLSHLRLLRYLDLSFSDLERCTDWLQQIHKLHFLTELYMSSCRLLGTMSPLLPFSNSSSTPLAIVDLSSNQLNSPSSYKWLFNSSSSLIHIDMSHNPLRCSVPDLFGSMASLENLYLVSCQLKGELPKSFRNLSHLNSLDLSNNNLRGHISEFVHALADTEKNSLEFLILGSNKFCGSLPDITVFPSLRRMSIRDNKLDGCFPESSGQISSLFYLDFSYNQITGSFPDLTLFPSLRELSFSNNHLHGRFPKCIGLLYQLEILDASSNSLEDTILEEDLSNLSNLRHLDLSFNSLALEFNFDSGPPFQLDIILLAYCNLGTHFPKWLQTQTKFYELDISGAGIFDTIPHWFWDLSTKVKHLNISHNHIQGVLPDLSPNFAEFATIDLSFNHFVGPIPLLPPQVTVLHLSQNMFVGPVSFFCKTAYKFLFSLDLSDNQLSGELPNCWMRIDQLNILNLANNKFSGNIPTSIGFLHHLRILQLRNNTFIGELPSSLKDSRNLTLLDLSDNKLSGQVPTWLGTHLPSLIVISLRKNVFFGSIPPHICYLNNARVLDLSQNNISGSIPLCVNNLTSMVQRNSSNAAIDLEIITQAGNDISTYCGTYISNALVQWKGKESEYRKTLGLLKIIDLSSNKLSGKIPQELATLEGLVSLNLSRNNLTGNIIQKIGQMKMLESLDLSKNRLSGEIPKGLATLTFLCVLDLSNNNFTGKIPLSTQLQSFNASVYAGNDKLCGLPLPHKCLPPPNGHGTDHKNEGYKDRTVTIGFYISVVLGFVVGFWGFFGPIMLRSTWRHAYFKFLDKIQDWIYVTVAVNMARLLRKLKR